MLEGYEREVFAAPDKTGRVLTHDVYTQGMGPVVVIIQELPGIGEETLALADSFRARGFSVVLPHLFGPLGRTSMVGNLARVTCMWRELGLFRTGGSSPVVTWLRALCQSLRKERGVEGVGVIGMCLTGSFAWSLMADESVLAGVASQPSAPLHHQRALQISDSDAQIVKSRLDEVGPMMALRFDGDRLCTAARFEALDARFNQGAERVRMRTLPGRGHSVLTLDFVDEAGHPTREALDEVLDYFEEVLRPGAVGERP